MFLNLLILAVEAAYLAFMAWLAALLRAAVAQGRRRAAKRAAAPPDDAEPPLAMVVVPFRDESPNLPRLAADLAAQDHPRARFVMVDDHSSDGGAGQLRELTRGDSRFTVIELPDGAAGKKAAVEAGVEEALACGGGQGFVLFTDADCRRPAGWVSAMVSTLDDECGDFCLGPVAGLREGPEAGRALPRIQAVEVPFLAAAGQAMALAGRPVMCNGANMGVAARYARADLRRGIASGDDVFRLRDAVSRRLRVVCCLDREAVVRAPGEATAQAWVNQRARWAGKARAYTDTFALLVTCGVASAQILALLALVSAAGWAAAAAWCLKLAAEVHFLRAASRAYGIRRDPLPTLALGLVYPALTVLVILFPFFGSVRWKGREIEM